MLNSKRFFFFVQNRQKVYMTNAVALRLRCRFSKKKKNNKKASLYGIVCGTFLPTHTPNPELVNTNGYFCLKYNLEKYFSK